MWTALLLLFLLALGAYRVRHGHNAKSIPPPLPNTLPTISGSRPWLDRLQDFDVFSKMWFTSIYVLLFISLIGCLTPRLIEHARSLRPAHVRSSRNPAHLPKQRVVTADGSLDSVAYAVAAKPGSWREKPP